MPATDHFTVTPTALDSEARAATEQSTAQQRLSTDVSASPPPADAFGQVPSSSRFADFNTTTVKGLSEVIDDQTTSIETVAQGVHDSADGYRTADARIAEEFDELAGTAGRSAPRTVASASGQLVTGAFADQVNANRGKVQTALTDEQANLAALQAQRTADPESDALRQQVEESQRKVDLYQNILDDNRKIVVFDPTRNGRIVEMVGDINADTRNVMVYTPGTFARMGNEQDAYNVVNSFVQASPDKSLAGFVYQDGDFPQSLVTQAPDPSYSQAMAPRLAEFTHQLDAQIAANAPGANVTTTGMAWSYGGAVLGLSDQQGATFDREIYVEGAGMGHGVWNPSDLQSGVTRYAMTAPVDPIQLTQGTELFGIGHGADPDLFPGNIKLDTGNFTSGWPITWQHDGWTQVHSDAWWNLYHAMTGGPVTSGGEVR
ncbi:alpha/beta hydrolase [Jatrophihabitans sp. YIM 134969]